MKWFLISEETVENLRRDAAVLSLLKPGSLAVKHVAEGISRQLDRGVREFNGTHPDNLIDDGK